MGKLRFGGQAAGVAGAAYLAGHGFDFIDINLNEMEKVRREATGILEAAERGGLFFVAHAPDLRVDNTRGLKKINEAIEFSAIFSPRTITIHPILAPGSNTPEKIRSKLREIGRLAELAGGSGSKIACENTSETAADMGELLDMFPEVVLTLDIGHSELLSDRNKSLDFISAYPDRIGHVHIHDNIGGNTYYEDLHLPLGEGRIEFGPILKALKGLPREVTITFEMPREKAFESIKWLRERDLV
ncbi:MAG: sugar phosphate isomerase/epimerase [Actinomycetota bacterium]